MKNALLPRATSELLGTAFLVAAVRGAPLVAATPPAIQPLNRVKERCLHHTVDGRRCRTPGLSFLDAGMPAVGRLYVRPDERSVPFLARKTA